MRRNSLKIVLVIWQTVSSLVLQHGARGPLAFRQYFAVRICPRLHIPSRMVHRPIRTSRHVPGFHRFHDNRTRPFMPPRPHSTQNGNDPKCATTRLRCLPRRERDEMSRSDMKYHRPGCAIPAVQQNLSGTESLLATPSTESAVVARFHQASTQR